MAMKKPKKSGSEMLQPQGLFPGAASPGQCRIQIILWVDHVRSSGSSQIFN